MKTVSESGEVVLSFKPGNPFAEKAIRYHQHYLKLNKPTAREDAMKNAFPLGAGFGHGSMRSRERSMDSSLRRASDAVRAKQNSDYYIALAEAFDRGDVNAQGRAVKSDKVKQDIVSFNDMIMKTVKVGDMIDIGGNTPLKVAKVNAKSVITVDGGKWLVSEIARVIPANTEVANA